MTETTSSLKGQLVSYKTGNMVGSATVPGGESFEQTLTLKNDGQRRWTPQFQLSYLGGDSRPAQESYSLPVTAPGKQSQVTIKLTAPRNGGRAITFWQLRDPDGRPFGGYIGPEVQVTGKPAPVFDPRTWRQVIWAITGIFESGKPGGRPEAYQNTDSGIVSYGAHQVTLSSGNLGRVLSIYFKNSDTPTSQALENEYAARVGAIDANLRNDTRFRDLLLAAATEAAMVQAQDDVFATQFYNPAVAKAQQVGLKTPLGVAIMYDTFVQHGPGGANFLVGLTQKAAGGDIGQAGIDEQGWLGVFLNEREALLNRLGDKSERNGDPASARALRASTFRVRELRQLWTANNFGLEGQFTVRTHQITGLA